jgi:hypothetical protein
MGPAIRKCAFYGASYAMPSCLASSARELVHRQLIDSDMREQLLLFCLLGLLLTAGIILMIAPGAVTWALSLIE